LSGGLAGYSNPLSNNGILEHAIVGSSDGTVHDFSFNQVGQNNNVLGYFVGVTSVAAYYDADPTDGNEHVIVAAPDGNLTDIVLSPQGVLGSRVLARFNGIVAIAGFYSSDDLTEHVIVGTSDGNVTEVFFTPQSVAHFAHLTQYTSPIVAVGALYSADDSGRHAIIATADGNIHDYSYGPGLTPRDKILINLGGIVDLAGFYTPDDTDRHVIVGTSNGQVREIYYLQNATGVSLAPLMNYSGIVHIGAYFTANDNFRHALVETSDGVVHEIFYGRPGIFQDTLTSYPPQPPIAQNISPNLPDGTVQARPSTAGRTLAVAGDTTALYAVTLDAGIWKSVNNGPWTQLTNAPEQAYSIAVDPNNHAHLAVGTRNGDAADPRVNTGGVYESFDAGATWSYTFDPLSRPGTTDQVIPALAFGPTSTLFIATANGIGRKASGTSTFDFSHSPVGVGLVTGISVSQTKVWARTPTQLLVSSNDGVTWTVIPIPTSLNGFNISFNARGDVFSLGAIDSTAVLVFKPNPDTVGNKNTVLLYDAASGNWLTQVLDTGDGTGLGGQRFEKSFLLNRPDLPATLGQRFRIFASFGEDIEQAVGRNADGTLQWAHFAQTMWGGPYGYPPNDIHSDVWGFNIESDLRSWVACDGGIYTNNGASSQWVTDNAGLNTQHIHTLGVLDEGPVQRPELLYPTADNDHWYQGTSADVAPTAPWHGVAALGDANWTVTDAGNPAIAVVVRNPQTAYLTAFGQTPPSGSHFTEGGITLNNDGTFSGPLSFQFIQTLKGESPAYPLGDAVMLVNLPLQTLVNGQLVNVPGVLGQPNPNGTPVLIRNAQFAGSPDANASKFQTWSLVAKDLPRGTLGFWVSGGHANPVYYVYAQDPNTRNLILYKRNASGVGWSPIFTGLQPGGWFGPAFVNPYNPNQLYIQTPAGVKFSTNGGASFQSDTILTALLTGSGKYPFGSFSGGSETDLPQGSVDNTNGLATLEAMSFNRDNPSEVVAASPFSGVFYNNGDGNWRDLTPALPRPLTSVSAVGITDGAVYATEEGHGIFAIANFRNASLATFFQLQTTSTSTGLLATLLDSRNVVVAGATVHLHITTLGGAVAFDRNVTTDASGRVFIPSGLTVGKYVFDLQFLGNAGDAPSETAYVHYTGAQEIFVLGLDNQVYAQNFDPSGNSASSYFLAAPGQVKDLVAGHNASNQPVLFVIGQDNQVYSVKFDANGNSLGGYALASPGQVKALAVGHDASNDPELFVIGLDNQVYALKCDANGTPLGRYFLTQTGQVKTLAAASDASGAPELFAIGLDDQVYFQKLDASGSSTSAYQLVAPGQVKALSVSTSVGVAPELFVIGLDNQVYGTQLDTSGNPLTGYFLTRPGQVQSLATFPISGGAELFVTGLDNQVYAQKFDAAGSSTTGYFLTAPGQVRGLSSGHDALGDPELFVIGQDGQLYDEKFDAFGNPLSGYALTQPGTVKAVRPTR
jgi:hypothetical protein